MNQYQYKTRMSVASKTESFGEKYKLLRRIQADLKDESVRKLKSLSETFMQLALSIQTLKEETEREYSKKDIKKNN